MVDKDLEQKVADLKEELSKLEDVADIETEYPDLYERMQKLWAELGGRES